MTKKEEINKDAEDLLVKAESAAKRLEDANTTLKGLLEEQAQARVENTLGGTTEAGKEEPEKTQDELDVEGARKLLGDTGYADELFPEKEKKEKK